MCHLQTICYAVYDPAQHRSRAGPPDCVLIEMLKLVAVLVNEIKWSDGDAAASTAVLQTIHRYVMNARSHALAAASPNI